VLCDVNVDVSQTAVMKSMGGPLTVCCVL